MPEVSNVRIVDPYVISLIEREQEVANESTATKTAQRLIVERAMQLEADRVREPSAEPTAA